MPPEFVTLKEQAQGLQTQDLNEVAWRCRRVLFVHRWFRRASAQESFAAYLDLGLVHHMHGRHAQAARVWRRALRLAEQKFGPASHAVATALDRLVHACLACAEVAATREFNANGGFGSVTTAAHGRMLWQAAFDRSPHRAQALVYVRRLEELETQLSVRDDVRQSPGSSV